MFIYIVLTMEVIYNEYFNKKKAQYIINNYEYIKDSLRPESSERLNNINIDPLNLLKKYISKSKPTKHKDINKISVSYKQTNKNIGRYFAGGSLSLQNIPREIRHTIASELYYDFDIKNAHPEILCQYADKHKLETKYIKKYIDNRTEILKEYSDLYKTSEDKIKTGFLSILNGAKSFLKLSDTEMPPLVRKFKKEVIFIQQYIFNNELTYKKIGIINAKNKQNKYNYNNSNELGSTMNIMLCDIENNILQCMINYLNEKNLLKNDVTMVFDGFMIPKQNLNNINIDNLLLDLENEIKNELDYNIKLVNKPMTLNIDTNINFNITNNDEDVDSDINTSGEINNIIRDDNDAANRIINLLDNKLYNCQGTLYYKYNNKWIDNLKLIKSELKRLIMEFKFIKHSKATKDDLKDGCETFIYNGHDYCTNKFDTYSADNKNASNILETLITKVIINDNLIETIIKSSHGKIFFKNGYYDFKQTKFINNFDNVETLVINNWDYVEVSLDKQLEVKKLFFESVFNEDTEEFLLMMARALGGFIEDKIWTVIFGGRDGGKSGVIKFITLGFGAYIITINANSLLIDNNSGDEAKKMSWAYNFDKYRVAFSNEMKVGVEGDGNIIKRICSGGDKLLVRKNNIDEKEVISQTTLILCCNELCDFKPNDVFEKLIPFSLKSKFVNFEITPKLLKENPYYKKASPDFDNLINDKDNINAMINLIINSFKPHKVVNNKHMSIILSTFNEDSDIINILLDNFEITDNKHHKLYNDEMKTFLKEKNIKIPFSKVVNILNTKGVNYSSRVNPETNIKKMCFVGLIRKNTEIFIDDQPKGPPNIKNKISTINKDIGGFT